MIVAVDAPHFCAGFEVVDGKVGPWCAPILAWARGKSFAWFKAYAARKRWRLS